MRKLLILLLIPLFGFSQISYKDVMSIKSVDGFKKVVIENGYEYESLDEEGWLTYGFNILRDSIEGSKSSKWMLYNTKDDRFTLSFGRRTVLGNFFGTEDDTSKNPYDLIVKDIKEKCKYYKIINYNGIDYVSYGCSDSSYKGKIGFVVSEGNGLIRHFPNTN
jgi:hypothetical protein